MKFKDYYAILGVEPSAGEAEIKAAYRRLARKYHPDVSKESGAEDKFKAINEAYEVLRDGQKRQAYDQLRAQGYRPGDEVRQPEWGTWRAHFDPRNPLNFSEFFEHLFKHGHKERGGYVHDHFDDEEEDDSGDVRAQVFVPLKTVYDGGSVRVTVNQRQLDVRIPQGITVGQVIRLAGQGNHGGNLLLEVDYAPDPQFDVDGRNILYTLPLTPWQAALGTQISVPTLGGTVELKIPPGSDSGRKLRLRGRGLPGKNNTANGDQIVELEISTPAPLNDTQRQAYKALAQAFGVEY